MQKVRVWDLPTRLFHWLLVLAVLGLFVTGSLGGNLMVWHMRFGYAVVTLILFRLGWGFFGGRWSRFLQFVPSPVGLLKYLKGAGSGYAGVGHNPLGALSVLALLGVLSLQVATGLISDDEIAFTGPLVRFVSADATSQATSYHTEVGKFLLLGLVGLHLAAMAFYKLVRKKALIPAMVHGDQLSDAPDSLPPAADSATTRLLAACWLAVCAAGVYWVVSLGTV